MKRILYTASSLLSLALGTFLLIKWRRRRALAAKDALAKKIALDEETSLDNAIALMLQEKRDEAIEVATNYVEKVNPNSFYGHLLLCQIAQDKKTDTFEKIEKLRDVATNDEERRLVEILLTQIQEPTKIVAFDGVPKNVRTWLFLCSQQITIAEQLSNAQRDLITAWANQVIKSSTASNIQISYAWTLLASISNQQQAANCHSLAIEQYDKNISAMTHKATQSAPAEAEALLSRALAINPNSVMARIVQSDIFIRQGKMVEAEEALVQGIKMASDNHRVTLNVALIRVLQLQNKYQEIVDLAQENMKNSDDFQTFFAMASILYNLAQLKLETVDNEVEVLSKEAKNSQQSATLISRYVAYADGFKKIFAKEPKIKEALTAASVKPPYTDLLEEMAPTLSNLTYVFDNSKESTLEVFSLVRVMIMLNTIGTPVMATFYDFEEVLHTVVKENMHLLELFSNAYVCFLLIKDFVQKKRRSILFDGAFLSATKAIVAEQKESKDSAKLIAEVKKLL